MKLQNIWKSLHTTITGLNAATIILIVDRLLAGQVNWQGIIPAVVAAIIGALSGTKMVVQNTLFDSPPVIPKK